ncbi:oxidoreductase [Dyadobacter sp. Leaf189]|uniref:oxidoreductase n=1 Tax=Dyadobacter sp. Leaf189 TaxID=1736295 RepID=UPI0006FEB5FA|nr:oxidoreductase [Dyadobacter sp. Leaf189]KQS27036.1 short-chain dehydrogenase [Dyadobacter sp. Leaf189]
MSTQKVWFITGASKGLGLSLAKQLLAQGQKVAATSRNLSELKDAVGVDSSDFLPLSLNLTNEADVQLAVANTITAFGRIDVLVNNAGYGLTGALEELSDAEARANFDINVFGALNLIRQVLPQMRNQQSGHIFNISSIGGFAGGFPGFGIYCATKFAVHGFSESLFHEVAPFGIHVTLVMPGYFRTNFLGAGSLNTPQKEMTEYTNVRESQQAHQNSINANQPGDPEKAAAVFISVSGQAAPPFHLFLGEDAYGLAGQKIALVQQEMEAQRALATATNF